jgi:hypothetical protein
LVFEGILTLTIDLKKNDFKSPSNFYLYLHPFKLQIRISHPLCKKPNYIVLEAV